MCGVAGMHRTGVKPIPKINEFADALLMEIEHRGEHAAGFLALMHNGKVQLEKAPIPAHRFIAKRGRIAPSAKTVLLHTRWATVGRKEDPRNAHPVASGTMAAIHNGTIYNASELFAQHQLPRIGEVDSEIVPALIHSVGWDKADQALAQFEGGAALVIVDTQHTDEVLLARTRGYPLVYMVTPELIVWASTRQAIEVAWRKTYPRKPLGSFHTLNDFHMARVNGSISISRFRQAPKLHHYNRSSRLTIEQRLAAVRATQPVSKRARKKARKASRSSVPNVAVRSAGWIETPEGVQYVGVAAAISYEALRDSGLTMQEALEIVEEASDFDDAYGDQWLDDEPYFEGARSGRVRTKSEATLAWEALGDDA